MKKLKKIKVILFLIALFVLPITGLVWKKGGFLVSEQRYKTKLEKISLEKVLSGKYWKNFEDFFSDHFPLRSGFIKAKYLIDKNIGQRKILSDVIISENNDMLFRYRTEEPKIDEKELKDKLLPWKNINDFLKKKNIPFIIVGIPDQSHMFTDRYPKYAINQEEYYQNIRKTFFGILDEYNIEYLDMDSQYRDQRDDYYFIGDHHQNFKASLKTYDLLVEKVSKEYFPMENMKDKLDFVESDLRFSGSHSRKIYNIIQDDTSLVYANPKTPIPFERYEDGNKVDPYINNLKSFYYNSYMGGDKKHTVIDTQRKDLKNILVIGDSTTNSLESILWTNSNKFSSIDLRSFDKFDFEKFFEENPQDLVIVNIISGNYNKPNEVLR